MQIVNVSAITSPFLISYLADRGISSGTGEWVLQAGRIPVKWP